MNILTVKIKRDGEQLRVDIDTPYRKLETGCLDWDSDDGYPGEALWLRKELLNFVAGLNLEQLVIDFWNKKD